MAALGRRALECRRYAFRVTGLVSATVRSLAVGSTVHSRELLEIVLTEGVAVEALP